MDYKLNLDRGKAILNFSEEFCRTSLEILESSGFDRVMNSFIKNLQRKDDTIYRYLKNCNDDKGIIEDLKIISKLLLVMNADEICHIYQDYAPYFCDREMFISIVEAFYLFWRRLERYAVVYNKHIQTGFQNVQFVEAQNKFEELVLSTYRKIEESALGYKQRIYRQITAGVNAGLIVSQLHTSLPEEYHNLKDIPFIQSVTIHPPFITYSKRNKRDGVFPEIYENPIENIQFKKHQWFCYPAKVGDLIAFVYFNVAFMSQGVTLCNLFELACEEEYLNRKPDMIYVYGYDDGQKNEVFYQDNKNDMMVALLSAHDDFDYFGYMKKMILTLHNVRKINHHQLPIHGAMVKMILQNGDVKNVVVMGDSGAGKSETIEQIKVYGAPYIREIKTIYDDMGVLMCDNGVVKTSGTEIGAFVRLDDLDVGYGYKELDRSVFMNPDKINARIVIPITPYKDVVEHHNVDYFLYANNYESDGSSLTFFDNIDSALDVFRSGKRMAKGTTTESGIVESYFANPFGPVQRQEMTDKILVDYFQMMINQGVKIGQIRTRLGIVGREHSGPKEAAIAILKEVVGDNFNIPSI